MGSSRGAEAVLVKPQIVASSKRLRLLCFLLKNNFSRKTFGKAPLEELEPVPQRKALPNKPSDNFFPHFYI
jgi:hypothetical protein